ncbi:ATP-binding protein [Photobacterium minamisatsumaniensis]|uniref:ATP-binding protein n=1 Tax=Photobacterium minamisatsumaniensis TaxID=2910233 RepID=UPI003D143D55
MKLKSYLALTTLATTSSIVVVVTTAIFYLLQNAHINGIEERGLELARVLAHDPVVIQAVEAKNQQQPFELQTYIEDIRSKTDASFIVVTDQQAMRLTHPDVEKIGLHFNGDDIYPSLLQGVDHTSVASGTLGKAIRNFSPIINNGKVIGAVNIGYMYDRSINVLLEQFGKVGGLIVLVYLLGVTITGAFVFKMKRTFLDYEPEVIVHKFREHEMILNSIRDAIIAVDNNMLITTVNQSASKMLSMGIFGCNDYIQQPLSTYSASISHLVLSSKGKFHQGDFNIGKHSYRADIYPIKSAKGIKGHVIVFFANLDQSELEREVIYLKNYAELLRSKTHEYSNKLNVLSGMLQIGKHDEAVDFIQQETDNYQSIIRSIVTSVNDSAIAGLLMAKFNKASDLGVKFTIDADTSLSSYQKTSSEKFVTILGNLIDNALLAAWQNRLQATPEIQLYLSDRSQHIIMEIQDTGVGVPAELSDSILEFGISSKSDEQQNGVGLYLVNQLVDYFHGSLDWERTEDNTTLFSIYLDKDATQLL